MIVKLLRSAEKFGTPLYVYDFDAIKSRLLEIRSLIDSRIMVIYAVKANPNVHLLTKLKHLVDGLDVSSGGEINQALLAGYQGSALSFAGPGKTSAEIEIGLQNDCASLSIESTADLARVISACQRIGKKANISLRINPQSPIKEFAIKMGGIPTQFGIDEEDANQVMTVVREHNTILNFIGFHVYAGTQCLNIEGLTKNIVNTFEVVEKICSQSDCHPKRINFGGGLGVPYFSSDKDFNLKEFTRFLNSAVSEFDAQMSQSVLYIIELGRYIVGPFGYYLSKVLAVKETRGQKFVILDGGIHHNLSASGNFGQVISKNYDIENISNPNGPKERVDIVGCLCTTLDRLASRIEIEKPRVGDVVAIKNSGAYGFTASPLLFLGHNTPAEVMISNDEDQLIRESKPVTEFN